jgi:beta-galactosidase
VLAGGAVVDEEKTTFGVRTIAVDAKNGFRLNGVGMKLKGGCVHHDNGLLGSASYDRAEERKIELMKASGYNAIRCAHNPPAPAMLDACDRLGMLVIDETFDCWRMGKNPNDYQLYFEDWWQRDTESMVRRDRNHPSIIMWSIGNEVGERTGISDGYAWCKKQADCVRALDNTRFVTSAVPFLFEELLPEITANPDAIWDIGNGKPTDPAKDRWGNVTKDFFAPLDVGGYNYLNNRYPFDAQQFPERVVCGTETWPHQAFATWDSTMQLVNVIGDFVWTSIDYLGESGIGKVTVDAPEGLFFSQDPWPYHLANCGDIDICGFKRPQSYYRDILWGMRSEPYIAVLPPQYYGKKIVFNPWGWEPVIASWDFPGTEGLKTQVDVYSDSAEVELLVNGASAGRRPAGAANKNKATFEVAYAAGKVEAVAYSAGKETGRFALHTPTAPAALRLTADHTVLKAAYGDLAYVTVEIVDRRGAVVKHASDEVSFEISGVGDVLAVGTANPVSEELYVGSQRCAFEGRLLAVVRSSGDTGEITLKATAPGLETAEIRLVTN